MGNKVNKDEVVIAQSDVQVTEAMVWVLLWMGHDNIVGTHFYHISGLPLRYNKN